MVEHAAADLPEVTISESAGVRYLHLGTPWVQGAMRIDDPIAIELEYVRRAVDPVLRELRRRPPPGGFAHAFNGSEQQAAAFVALGIRLGFGGASTFERALRIRRVGRSVAIDAIVMETDSPDIAPQWRYRTAAARASGATMRNEPAELARIGAELAALRGDDVDAFAAATTANALASLPRLATLIGERADA